MIECNCIGGSYAGDCDNCWATCHCIHLCDECLCEVPFDELQTVWDSKKAKEIELCPECYEQRMEEC